MTSLEACASSLRAWQSSQTAVLVGAPEDDMKEVPIIDLDLLRTFEGDEATLAGEPAYKIIYIIRYYISSRLC